MKIGKQAALTATICVATVILVIAAIVGLLIMFAVSLRYAYDMYGWWGFAFFAGGCLVSLIWAWIYDDERKANASDEGPQGAVKRDRQEGEDNGSRP